MPSFLAPFALAAALLAAESPPPLRLPPDTPDTLGTITGRIVSGTDGRHVPYASVIVLGTRRGAMADEEGRFRIDRVPRGRYDLRVRVVGSEGLSHAIHVAPGANDVGVLRMPGCPPPDPRPVPDGEPALEATIRPVKSRFRVGDAAEFDVRIRNRGPAATTLVSSVDGSDRGASPVVRIEITGPPDGYQVRGVAFCGNRNGISPRDFVTLEPGEAFDPYRGGWKGTNLLYGNFRKPGRYTARFTYSTASRDIAAWASAPGGPPCRSGPSALAEALADVPAVELEATTTFHVDR
jgi:hypothetical protein